MGHTWLCFVLVSPLLPSSHTGGIWNLLAAESHRAIKPSKAHKHTRGRTSNNVGPTSCQQTQYILNLSKPHCSFFILSVSPYASLNYSSHSLAHKHHLGMNWGKIFYIFTPTWNWWWCGGSEIVADSGDWDHREKTQTPMVPDLCRFKSTLISFV